MSDLSSLGERKIIELIYSLLDKPPITPIMFGDDVSAIPLHGGRLAVLKTDMLVGSIDVPPGMSLYQAARKAAIMNISDFAAKGVRPLVLLVSLGLPRSFTKKDVEALAEGLNRGAREHGAYVIGGDTSEAPDLIIACMLYGVARSLIPRSGARPGDILAVTGYFGNAAAGLKLILEGLDAPSGLKKTLIDSVYLPKARLAEGLALVQSRAATSSIDSSDGLAVSLHELRKMSKTGFTVNFLPLAEEAKKFAALYGFDARELALYGGEEYELIVTIRPDRWLNALEAVHRVGGSLIQIGVVTKETSICLVEGEKLIDIHYRGWEHFKSSNASK
jgi:thiamine-monophosphate kinase